MQDKIKISGFGVAMIKLFCFSGFLLEDTRKIGKNGTYVPIVIQKHCFLFVDSLYLDRFRHLLKNITNLPIS